MSNLETCVSKRERILDGAMTNEKEEDIVKKNEIKHVRHLDFLRSKTEKLKDVSKKF